MGPWSAASRGRPPGGGLALAVFHMVPRVPAAPNLCLSAYSCTVLCAHMRREHVSPASCPGISLNFFSLFLDFTLVLPCVFFAVQRVLVRVGACALRRAPAHRTQDTKSMTKSQRMRRTHLSLCLRRASPRPHTRVRGSLSRTMKSPRAALLLLDPRTRGRT